MPKEKKNGKSLVHHSNLPFKSMPHTVLREENEEDGKKERNITIYKQQYEKKSHKSTQ